MENNIIVGYPNGYTGILYGESSLLVLYNNKKVLHTVKRSINTEEELRDFLREVPALLEDFRSMIKPTPKALFKNNSGGTYWYSGSANSDVTQIPFIPSERMFIGDED